jgi:CheY-like chemotaxis protein
MKTLTMIAQRLGKHVAGLRGSDAHRPRRILVVDDDALTREYLREILTDAGYAPTVAIDGADALAKWEESGPFDALMTDLVMPIMTGDELARCVRRLEPQMPVLYVTGHSDHLFEAKRMLWQNEAFLEKPCSPGGVVEALALLLRANVPQKTVWG